MSDPPTPPGLDALSDWLALEPDALLRDCERSPYQGTGPGGQKRNRVYSGVRLRHGPSGLVAESCEGREAGRNLENALRRLRLAMALAPQPESYRIDGDTVARALAPLPAFRPGANPRHPDFPRSAFAALLALETCAGRLSEAASALGCTASALTRFLAGDKAVWARAQETRLRHGRHPLKRS